LDHCVRASCLKPRSSSWERLDRPLEEEHELAQPQLRLPKRRSSCADFSLIAVTSLSSLIWKQCNYANDVLTFNNVIFATSNISHSVDGLFETLVVNVVATSYGRHLTCTAASNYALSRLIHPWLNHSLFGVEWGVVVKGKK
jgi:hypothetical protein